jgi:hypothetical protein
MIDPHELPDEELQAAVQAGRASGPEAERYQRLFAALRELDSPRPPADFASSLESAVARSAPMDLDEPWEVASVRLGLGLLAAIAVAAPVAGIWLLRENLARILPAAPWTLLLATSAALLVLAWLDRAPRGQFAAKDHR